MSSPADRDISFPRTSGNSLSTHTSPHHRGLICLKTVLLPTAPKTSNLTSGSSAKKGKLAGVQTERIGIAILEVLKAVLLKIEDVCQVPLHRWIKSFRRFERSQSLHFRGQVEWRPVRCYMCSKQDCPYCSIIHKWKHPTFLRFALKRSVSLSSELYLAGLVQRHAPKTLKT